MMTVILNKAELLLLVSHHTNLADYFLGCKQSNVEIANKNPVRISGTIKTKEDWLGRAQCFDEKRKYHRQRAKYFNNLLKQDKE